VLASSPRSYVWDAALTAGKYAFSVYGPDGFLTSFGGQVVPPARTRARFRSSPPRCGRAGPRRSKLTLANDGSTAVVYTLTPNDYKGSTKTVTVKLGSPKTASWPVNQDGCYDEVITASSAGGFRRRYAGRIA
jgi:phospholipase C